MGVNIPGINVFANQPQLVDADLFTTTGRVVYVGAVACPGGVVGVDAAGAYGDSPQKPFATIDYAIGQLTASRGDTIVVLPGHTETVTAAITMDVAAVRIIGLGLGRNRPAITPSGAIDTLTVTAANCAIHNLRLIGQAADSTASINIAAADFRATNCIIEQGATPLVGVTVASGGDRFHFNNCQFIGTAAGPDVAIDLEAKIVDWVVENCKFNYANSAGLDLAVIRSDDDAPTGGLFNNCTVIGFDVALCDFDSSDNAQGDGLISNIYACAGAGISNIDTANDHGGFSTVNVLVTDSVTESGARVPVATPA